MTSKCKYLQYAMLIHIYLYILIKVSIAIHNNDVSLFILNKLKEISYTSIQYS